MPSSFVHVCQPTNCLSEHDPYFASKPEEDYWLALDKEEANDDRKCAAALVRRNLEQLEEYLVSIKPYKVCIVM